MTMRQYVRDELQDPHSELNAELRARGYVPPNQNASNLHRYVETFSETTFGRGLNTVVAPLLHAYDHMNDKCPREGAPEIRYVAHYLFKITVFIRGSRKPSLSEESDVQEDEENTIFTSTLRDFTKEEPEDIKEIKPFEK